METKLRNLLDLIYELEGLVHLSLKRTELHDDFLRLISIKGKKVQDLCSSLSANTSDSREGEPADSLKNVVPETPPYVLEEYSLDDESEVKEDFLYEIEEEVDENTPPKIDSSENSRGKLVFSINDKFRYKRDLFENSEAEFNNTLALVASMENYEEAEDYFINEQGWDAADDDVRDFLDIIKRYFK